MKKIYTFLLLSIAISGAIFAQVDCETPSGLSVSNLTATSATLSWDAVDGVDGYTFQFENDAIGDNRRKHFDAGITSVIVPTPQLVQGETYIWSVKSVCGVTTSDWDPGVLFTVPFEADIIDIHGEDADGDAISLEEIYTVQGIVYGVDLRGGGLSFTIIDATGGINVFSFDEVDDYVVTEGDEIRVTGEIDQYAGLTEIIPSVIEVISTGNDIGLPTPVTALDESTESNYISLSNCTIDDDTDWLGGGSSFNVDITCDGGTFVMRIDDLTELSTEPVPTGSFNLWGIGGQFTFSSPALEGYQIFPMYNSDFISIPERLGHIDAEIDIYPNPNNGDFIIRLNDIEGDASIQVFDLAGKMIVERVVSQNEMGTLVQLKLGATGVYQVVVRSSKGNSIEQVVVQ